MPLKLPTKTYNKHKYEELIDHFIAHICGELDLDTFMCIHLKYYGNFVDHIKQTHPYTNNELHRLKRFINILRRSGDFTPIYKLRGYLKANGFR
jgi:uncharacterized short protein YbdD (DUF466 family)